SDDKMLVGRTFSYSDTQRYRVGTNYLQLPVNSPKGVTLATNLTGGSMSQGRDMAGQNPHVNYEPSLHGGPQESTRTENYVGPEYGGTLVRQVLGRTNDYIQARERFSGMLDWERDELVNVMTGQLNQCERDVQERMVWHFFMIHDDYGARVAAGIGLTLD